jgi:hypothetical protein
MRELSREHFLRVLSRLPVISLFIVLSLAPFARANSPFPNLVSASSVSGQFVVTEEPGMSPLRFAPDFIPKDEDVVRVEPAELAVSADRVRNTLLKELGVDPNAPWSGKIFLALHPARSLDENVEIFSSRFGPGWNYHVLLPDMLPRQRLARGLTGVLLMEYANRSANNRSAEMPPWLVDGLAQELLASDLQGLIVSAPDGVINGIPTDRVNTTQRGLDSLTGARAVFQNYSILTFSQLSWPTEGQVSGNDGGAYRASAQLFVDRLLKLHDGAGKLRMMVTFLPRYYNWQSAFWTAFHEDFTNTLQVEKWWALQSVDFDSRSPGSQWTLAVSRQKLDEILSVPVKFRQTSNSLPATAEISLQKVIQSFDPVQQTGILQTKLRDLEIAQFRMAPSLAVLTAQYLNTLAAYLGEPQPSRGARQINKSVPEKISARDAVAMLNTLDARRRAIVVAKLPRAVE